MSFVIVFAGAGLGGMARHGANLIGQALFGAGFPLATVLVNVVGSLLMGMVAGYLAFRSGAVGAEEWRLFLATGILGGFTTFSAFSLDAVTLVERGDWGLAAIYVAASVVLSIGALALGLVAVRSLS